MTLVTALSTALAVEYAAVYGYGAAGPFVADRLAAAVQAGYDAHRRARDRWDAALRSHGADVPAPPAAYDLRPRPRTATAALQLLARLDDDTCAGCAAVVAAGSPGAVRDAALQDWQAAAVRAARWRLAAGTVPGTLPLPGLVAPPPRL